MKKINFSAKMNVRELKTPEEQSKLSEYISQIMDKLNLSQEELAIEAKVPRCSVRRILNEKEDCTFSNGFIILNYLHEQLVAKGLPSPFPFERNDPQEKK